MLSARNLFRKFVYSVEFRPWTPAEKRMLLKLNNGASITYPFAKEFWKRRFRPQAFLAHLRMELQNLVDSEWYRNEYLAQSPGVIAREFFVEYGLSHGHMPNAFIDLNSKSEVVPEGFWRPQSIVEFVLRADSSRAFIGERFSPGGYVTLYPDLGAAGVNPLTHYICYGRDEGRQAPTMRGTGDVEFTQGFNSHTLAADWISLRGTHLDASVTSVSLYKSGLFIGNARLGLPSVSGGILPATKLHGFSYSSALKVVGHGERLVVKSTDTQGHLTVLCEIDLVPEEPLKAFPRTRIYETEGRLQGGEVPPVLEAVDRRILILTHHLGIGGGQLYLQEVLRGLNVTDGRNVTVVSMIGGVLEAELRDLGFEVLICDGPKPFSKDTYEQFMWDFEGLLSGRDFDVFLANTLGCFPQVDWCLRNGVNGDWAIHESYTLEGWARAAFGRPIDSYVLSRLEHALIHTKSLIFEAQGTLDIVMDGLPLLNAEIIKYGVEIPEKSLGWNLPPEDRQGTGPRKLRLLAVGTFEERKAQGLIVRCVEQLQELGFPVEVNLVGLRPGDAYSESIRQAVSNVGLQDIVTLHEVTPDWERFLQDADYFFMPSDIESMPQSMMIAMSHGVPAIGARVFGIPELVTDGVTGFIHEPNDLSDMIAVITKASRLPENEYLAMRHAAREFVAAEHNKSAYVDLLTGRLLTAS
jgi:glycosyltransferase involved in cell wall biosynthesis